MLTLDAVLHLPVHVVFTFVDQDAILLNTQTNKYFALDDVGARLWGLITAGKQLRESYHVLLEEYDVAPAQLEQDILELINHLAEHGLVQTTEK